MTRRTLFSALIFIAAFCADRITKWWALNTLNMMPWNVFPGLNFVISWNRGVSWSMFATYDVLGFWILTSFITLIICAFGVYTVKRAMVKLPVAFELLVIGGAVSNVIDRLVHGAVLDFIEVYVGSYSWPVFNIADACIVIGVGGMLLRSWWSCHE